MADITIFLSTEKALIFSADFIALVKYPHSHITEELSRIPLPCPVGDDLRFSVNSKSDNVHRCYFLTDLDSGWFSVDVVGGILKLDPVVVTG